MRAVITTILVILVTAVLTVLTVRVAIEDGWWALTRPTVDRPQDDPVAPGVLEPVELWNPILLVAGQAGDGEPDEATVGPGSATGKADSLPLLAVTSELPAPPRSEDQTASSEPGPAEDSAAPDTEPGVEDPRPALTSVDYLKLNQEIRRVCDTLDRFNRKLLRAMARRDALRPRMGGANASNDGKETRR